MLLKTLNKIRFRDILHTERAAHRDDLALMVKLVRDDVREHLPRPKPRFELMPTMLRKAALGNQVCAANVFFSRVRQRILKRENRRQPRGYPRFLEVRIPRHHENLEMARCPVIDELRLALENALDPQHFTAAKMMKCGLNTHRAAPFELPGYRILRQRLDHLAQNLPDPPQAGEGFEKDCVYTVHLSLLINPNNVP